MAVYDCIMFFFENLINYIMFNILNENDYKFVVVKATRDHAGKEKKLNFDIKNYKKFEHKIIYKVIDDIPEIVETYKKGWSTNFYRENFHRDSISKALVNCSSDDLIMISDADEIPNFKSILNTKINKFALLSQKNFYYKLNLQSNDNWLGTGICYKKYLKSPQWLRNKRFLRRGFFRRMFFKTQIIKDGGWHFSFLKTPKDIINKMQSYGHGELNMSLSTENIEKSINSKEFFINPNVKLNNVEIDDSYPDYIKNNTKNLSEWIF